MMSLYPFDESILILFHTNELEKEGVNKADIDNKNQNGSPSPEKEPENNPEKNSLPAK